MRTSVKINYQAPCEQILSMFNDPAYQLIRFGRAPLENLHANALPASADDAGKTWQGTLTKATVSPTVIPANASRFIKGEVNLALAQRWCTQPRSDSSYQGQIATQISGVPLKLSGQGTLTPTASGCELNVDIDATLAIPLFGERILRSALKFSDDAVAYELACAAKYLADHSAN